MQIIKPFRVSVLHRCFENEGRPYFSVALMLLFPLGNEEPELRTEKELWGLVGEEFANTVLDTGMPKQVGEFLLQAVAHPQGSASACRVRAKLGAAERTLYVSGDRYWKDGKATEAKPFEEMPISWENAYGGEGFDKNPLGKGFAPRGQEHHFRPLPNIENPEQLLRSPTKHPEPVGFLPVPMENPERLGKLGTFDERWLQTRFPGFAADMDWSYFNAAQPAQRIDGYWSGDEAYELENLVPGASLVEGRLPGATARCFIQRRGQDALEELRTRLDTVFFIPHRERGILIYRAAVAVTEDDASDIERMMVAAEWRRAPRDLTHYADVFKRRVDPENGYLEALRESDLMPDRLPKGALGEPPVPREGLRKQAAKRRVLEELENARELLRRAGQDPDALLPKIPEEEDVSVDPEDIPDQVRIMRGLLEEKKQEADERRVALEAQARETCQKHGIDFDDAVARGQAEGGGPPKLKQKLDLESVKQRLKAVAASGVDVPGLEKLEDPELLKKLDRAEDKLLETYQKHAHLFPAAAPLTPEVAKQRGEELIAAARAGENLWRRDFTRADLRGVALDELNLSGAFLEGADLSGASLVGCELSDVVLARARLDAADLSGATLERANLAEADLRGTCFARARMQGCTLMRSKLERANFEAAHLEGCNLLEAELERTNFEQALLPDVYFIRQALSGCRFAAADLSKAAFLEVQAVGVSFDEARLPRATFISCGLAGSTWVRADLSAATLAKGCDLQDADFRWAGLERATLAGSCLARSNFGEARLLMANLSEVDAQECKFYRADLRRATLSRSDLRGAILASANAMEALLDHADLRGVDLRGANLFRSDLSKVRVDKATLLTDALVEQARVVGRREDATT
ncbi:MAG: DUF2169 domain-containing protein [Myxococcales bacterium]|nr:DUF2169 domain-containing protein [Myxococcales bacterium]